MEPFRKIWEHPLYQEQFRLLQDAEKDRIFCNHTLEHFLDVARLTFLYALTEQAPVEKDLIYAAALLHDIGRYAQISSGVRHEKAGAELARRILPDCGYAEAEIRCICQAIESHRGHETAGPGQTENCESAEAAIPCQAENSESPEKAGQKQPEGCESAETAIPCQAENSESPEKAGQKQPEGCESAETAIPCQVESRSSAENPGSRKTASAWLARSLRRADKASRNCFLCPAASQCSWPAEKRNPFPDL